MPRRISFDPKLPLVAAREFIFAGKPFKKGDPFPIEGFALRLIRRQYEALAINHVDPADLPADPIQMTGPAGGRYTITAPWFEKPLVIRGKVNAEKALADVREEGAPLGWIDGGTEVEIEQIGDTLFRVSAPWLDDAEEIEGREAAEARQREIHQAGAPAPAADEGGEDEGDDSHQGDDDNSDKSESEPGASDDAGDGSGTDAPDGAGDAQTAGEAAGNAEAGKSKADAPADA